MILIPSARLEWRHLNDEEPLSTLRVLDNKETVYLDDCRYVGLLIDNTCKIVKHEDFCRMMKGKKSFVPTGDGKGIMYRMHPKLWERRFVEAEGMAVQNFRKTVIMRWNTDISNFQLKEFKQVMKMDNWEDFRLYWSVWEHEQVHVGDRCYMVRTGHGRNAVVMRGVIAGMPYVDEDWKGEGRTVYYVKVEPTHMVDPQRCPELLTLHALGKVLPQFDWKEGHSGMVLQDDVADMLEVLWSDYVEQVHDRAGDPFLRLDFDKVYRERGWSKVDAHIKGCM